MKKTKTKKPETTGDRIRKLLLEQGIQQKSFAVDLGVSAVTVSRWVNNEQTPASETLTAIANLLGVSVDYLKGGDYKNVNDMIEKKAGDSATRHFSMREFLRGNGYDLGRVVAQQIGDTVGAPWGVDFETMEFLSINHAIYEITTPGGENKYISGDRLEQLTNDFFTLLNASLFDNLER